MHNDNPSTSLIAGVDAAKSVASVAEAVHCLRLISDVVADAMTAAGR